MKTDGCRRELWWFRFPWRHLTEYPGRTFLSILGIALGAVFSDFLAATSATGAGGVAVAGKAEWRLRARRPSISLFPRCAHPNKGTAPVVDSVLELNNQARSGASLGD
jgi:hypothetical protein